MLSGPFQGEIPVPSAALPCLSPLLAQSWLSPFAVSPGSLEDLLSLALAGSTPKLASLGGVPAGEGMLAGVPSPGACNKCHFSFPGHQAKGVSSALSLCSGGLGSPRPFTAAPLPVVAFFLPLPHHTHRCVQSPFCLESHLEIFLRPSSDLTGFRQPLSVPGGPSAPRAGLGGSYLPSDHSSRGQGLGRGFEFSKTAC